MKSGKKNLILSGLLKFLNWPIRAHLLVNIVFVIALYLSSSAYAGTNPMVLMKTSYGDITVELFQEKAPKTVKNFLSYVDKKFYDGTIFHRVINDFMIQGGGLDQHLKKKNTDLPIENEASNGLSNTVGTLAMARTGDPHSATSQFFINVKDNSFLDFKSKTPRGYGYCVFAKVNQGMSVVNKIKQAKTMTKNGRGDVPVNPIIIQSIRRINGI